MQKLFRILLVGLTFVALNVGTVAAQTGMPPMNGGPGEMPGMPGGPGGMPGGPGGPGGMPGGPGGMPGMPGMPGGGGPQAGQIQINLTPEQRQDVDSLVNMGLGSQTECLQIYMACDKDVNQAASMLMDQAN